MQLLVTQGIVNVITTELVWLCLPEGGQRSKKTSSNKGLMTAGQQLHSCLKSILDSFGGTRQVIIIPGIDSSSLFLSGRSYCARPVQSKMESGSKKANYI